MVPTVPPVENHFFLKWNLHTALVELPLVRMTSVWVRFRYWLEWVALRAAVAVLPWFPLAWLRGLANGIGTLVFWCDPRGRSTALENLRVAFPEMEPARRRHVCLQTYRTFARTFMELFWARRFHQESVDQLAECHIASDATRAAMNTGCIFATLHAGNFEWLSRATALWGYPSMIVAANFHNPRLTPVFQELRAVAGHQVIPQENAVLRLFKHLKRGGRTALLVDLNVPPDQSATVIRCFGKLTCVTQAHAALAQRTGRPLVPVVSLPRPDGRYVMRYLEPIPVSAEAQLQEITQACWDAMEPYLKAQPEAWMWIYKHWRYLPPNTAAEEYPQYANRSKKFDKLLLSTNPTLRLPS
jgi:Kdo2-lipid IVA lauroyltransferase/acyltransferase